MFTLGREADYQAEIRKSRFIARAAPVDGVEAALAFLARIRDARATHHCWAYRIGDAYRFSDDGEPGGTAGRPILGAIEREEIDRVMVVVIRHYGGIKLGAGGLVRAYGGCAAICLQRAERIPIVETTVLRLKAGFEDTGALYAAIDGFTTEKLAERYSQDGIEVRLRIAQSDQPAMVAALTEASAGRMTIVEET